MLFIMVNMLLIALLYTALSFKTALKPLFFLRKTLIFAHNDARSTAFGVSFYRSYKIIFVGGNQNDRGLFLIPASIFATQKYDLFF